MTSYREYRRDLTKEEFKTLKIRHRIHLKNRGFLSPNEKQRLLKLKNKEHGTPEADFWYILKRKAKFAIFDLQLISKIADESQLQEIFEPFTNEDYNDHKKNNYPRTQLRDLIESVYTSHMPEKSNRDDWRYKLALDMATSAIGYFRNIPAFQSKLHTRLFEDVLDILDEKRDSTESAFS